MDLYKIEIKWEGPLGLEEVIKEKTDGGERPDYDGDDYGLYQIYGKHILNGEDTLLYIGKTTGKTFSGRFKQHRKKWLSEEDNIQIYLGRVYNSKRHSERDDWGSWEDDIETAEKILIYKYSPNYNGREVGNSPRLPFENVRLIHSGKRHKLEKEDNAPEDYS